LKLWPFRRKAFTGTPAVPAAIQSGWNPYPLLGGGSRQRIGEAFNTAQSANYMWMYTNSPAVRTVIDTIRFNIGQLDLRLYEELGLDRREPRPDHPAALSLRYPNPTTPSDKFVRSLFLDKLTYDNAYALVQEVGRRQLSFWWLEAHRVEILGDSTFDPQGYRYHVPNQGTFVDFPPEMVFHWAGENPHDQRLGLSKLETLRKVVAEDAALQQANVELANSGMQKPVWIFRPLDAPQWTPEARQRAEEDFRNRLKRRTDSPVIAEEGMELRDFGVNPNDAEALDVRKWLLEQVATAYGVPGPMVGLEGDLEKAQQIFYSDTLPPYTEDFTRALNHHVLVGKYGLTDYCFEFDLDEKLMGDERLKALTSASGRPVMLTNEARAKLNLPPVEGGDELVTPANVIVGDNPKPSTDVMPIQDPNGPSQEGDHREDEEPKGLTVGDMAALLAAGWGQQKRLEVSTIPKSVGDMNRQKRYIDRARAVMARHYSEQRSVLLDKGFKAAADSEKWNRKLADRIETLARQIVETEGAIYASRLGADDFDMGQVENYLKAMAAGAAEGINEATQRDISEFGPEQALERAQGQRAETAAASIGTRATVFAREEAAKQSPFPERRLKTWVPDTARHANLAGASVPLGQTWGGIVPGSQPNCKCSMTIT
jgi:HK97 family phage portal protein